MKQRISNTLELPADILEDIPRITMCDNREASIENYKGILEYDDGLIRLNAKSYIIKICGRGLCIYSITDEEIGIRGTIQSITFEHRM